MLFDSIAAWRTWVLGGLVAGTCAAGGSVGADERLAVHEWGTFIALQNDKGAALPGINIDDEPLPEFCHNLYPWALQSANALPTLVLMKGAPQRHPYVSLRLETPVIYFHPAKDEKLPFSIDVNVQFQGGWLTEFYPQARPQEPGLEMNAFHFGPITPQTIGGLTWRDVRVGAGSEGPATAEKVWLAPRNVMAAPLSVGPQTPKSAQNESEKFLFYRGVGNRPVPLRVECDPINRRLAVHGQCADVLGPGQTMRIANTWLVDIRRDGGVAWKKLEPMTVSNDVLTILAATSSEFPASQYSAAHLETLRTQMQAAMVGDGLADDEATAMLNTWKHAYFQSPGLRLFFLVPQTWTDAVLPLKLSRPAVIHRVMMGRIELISAEQRQLLGKLAATPVSDPSWVSHIEDSPAARKFREGRSGFGNLGVTIPADYQMYLDLGRFRNALVLAEQREHPTGELGGFINTYGLSADEVQ